MTLKVHILTLFPNMFPGTLGQSLSGKALKRKLWDINILNLRNFTSDKRGKVDDVPFGGGAGMIIKPDIISKALDSLNIIDAPRILFSPRGKVFNQELAKQYCKYKEIILICGRYEGFDQRVIDKYELIEISIGDYILSGGEVAGLVFLDAIIRLLPGVMNNGKSVKNESFENWLLEHPHFTKPRRWKGIEPPEILFSGHHEKIKSWREEQSFNITKKRRPDLWEKYLLSKNKDINY